MKKTDIFKFGINDKILIPNENKPASLGIDFDDEEGETIVLKIHESDIEELFKERKSNTRFYNFVWFYLFFNEDADFEEGSIGVKDATFADIEYFFDKECSDREAKKLARRIREKFVNQCIPTEALNWVSHSARVTNWFKGKIIILDRDNIHQFINLNGLPLIQAIIDQWEARSSYKIDFISDLQKKWETNIKSDHELRWLEDTKYAKTRRNLVWNEVCAKYGSKFNVDHVPKSHQDILEIFDQLADEGISKKEFIRSLQLKQSKQKNADNGRKPKNLDILLENHLKLKELATIWEVTERETMDRLIADGFEKELGKGAPSED